MFDNIDKLKEKSNKVKSYNIRYSCETCKDSGLVLMKMEKENEILEYGYRCFCRKGDDFQHLPKKPL